MMELEGGLTGSRRPHPLSKVKAHLLDTENG